MKETTRKPPVSQRAIFDAFARGVASAVGKGCWDVVQYDILRRSLNRDLAEAVVVHESGVSTKRRSGTIEFQRLVYVLATYDKTFDVLPARFPARHALRLSGIRFLAFREWMLTSDSRDKVSFENIAGEFSLSEFFVANEMAKDHAGWQARLFRARNRQGDDAELSAEVSKLDKAAIQSQAEYADCLSQAFGQRFVDTELRAKRPPLDVVTIIHIGKWAELIVRAQECLKGWLKGVTLEDHRVWQLKE